MNFEKLILYQNCIPVIGSKNAIICDLQNNDYTPISIDLYDFIIKYNKTSVNEIIKIVGEKKTKKYLTFLLKNNFAFLDSNINSFPDLNKNFEYPFKISNAVIEVSSNFNFNLILNQLDEINCKHVEFIIYENGLENLVPLLTTITNKSSIISSIGIVTSFEVKLSENKLIQLLKENPRIVYMYVLNSKENNFIPPIRWNNTGYIIYSKEVLKRNICGSICKSYFAPNIQNFTESLNQNSCLNRKISLDINGNIRNCPSMPQSFGNIKDVTLEDALNHKDFKKYWNLTKDKIEVCKDCEFRYICTDCRAYTERTNTNAEGLDTSKPLKCGYDPYTGEWGEWSTNSLKEKAIKYYGMEEMVKKN